ncbi:MAG: uracil-DNA glycosylase [Rickettsiales bacterium]|jgi:DNA polymerase|nr:uracil-DNA glycosylase [Rickettsiales bacterium]
MQDGLVVLLEWFAANGIGELFDDNRALGEHSGTSEEFGGSKSQNLGDTIVALAKQQRELKSLSRYDARGVREIADRANSLEELLRAVNGLEIYDDLRKTANSTVMLSGNRNPKIMLINDLPGDDDDLSGLIFSGQGGELLRKMFLSIDIDVDSLCLLNSFFWRLPGNRAPIREELEICRPIVERAIGLIRPEFIIFCGNYGVSTLLEQNRTIASIRGKLLSYSNCYLQSSLGATGMHSPSFLLKNTDRKRDAWSDLLKIKEFLLGI